MLATIGAPSLDALIDEAIPACIRLPGPLALPPGESEYAYLARLRGVAAKNRLLRSFIGLGYYDTHHAERDPPVPCSRTRAGTRPTRPTRPRSRRAASSRC